MNCYIKIVTIEVIYQKDKRDSLIGRVGVLGRVNRSLLLPEEGSSFVRSQEVYLVSYFET